MTFAKLFSTHSTTEPPAAALELACPIHSMVALRTAVDNGADWIHLDFDERHEISGFDLAATYRGIRYAHDRHCKVLLAVDAHASRAAWGKYREAIGSAARYGVDAIALTDPALMLYCAAQHPDLRLHYKLPDVALNSEAINIIHNRAGISRLLLPRVITLAQLAAIAANTAVELQVVGFGRLSSIIEGNKASTHDASETRGRDTQHCARVEIASNDGCYALDQHPDLSALKLLPRLTALGVRAITIEAAGRTPAQMAQIIRAWREAIDECLENLEHYSVKPSWTAVLGRTAEHRKIC